MLEMAARVLEMVVVVVSPDALAPAIHEWVDHAPRVPRATPPAQFVLPPLVPIAPLPAAHERIDPQIDSSPHPTRRKYPPAGVGRGGAVPAGVASAGP